MAMTKTKHYYFLGIYGISMRMLAWKLQEFGHKVSGTDLRDLKLKGIDNFYLQDGNIHLPDNVDCIVYNTDIPNTHPDLIEAKKRNIPIIHRLEIQDQLLEQQESIIITGSSGKTSTSYYVYELLRLLSKNPFGFIGGLLDNGKSYFDGNGPYVFEFTESDLPFTNMQPDTLILINFSLDHYWNYSNNRVEAEKIYKEEYKKLVSNSKNIIYNIDDHDIKSIVDKHTHKYSYGKSVDSNIRITDIQESLNSLKFKLNNIDFNCNLHGEYSVYNVAAAVTLCHYRYNIPLQDLVKPVTELKHVHRRMTIVYQDKDLMIIDDHVTFTAEFEAMIASLKKFNKKISFVYECTRIERFRCYKDEFIKIFQNYRIAVRQQEIYNELKNNDVDVTLIDDDVKIDEFFRNTKGILVLSYVSDRIRPYYQKWIDHQKQKKSD